MTEVADELYRLAEEFGDGEALTPDPIEATYANPVDRVEFDHERQAALLVTDR